MKQNPKVTLKEIAARWGVHRVTARRILKRHSRMGKKFGKGRSASVRYHMDDVEMVERQAVLSKLSPVRSNIPLSFPNLTLEKIAERWAVSRTTARRILNRFGCEAMKFGPAHSSTVRYSMYHVESIERRLGGEL